MIINLVILLICISKIYCNESEEGKYIDLLPEDEKREFLEKVARRILEEVESKDTIKKSGELSDGQLNKHSSYVSQVMKEEGNDIMKKRENDTNLMKQDVRSADSLTLINQDKSESKGKIENNEGNGHLEYIDLTLRQGKASIRENETEKRNSPTNKPLQEEPSIVAAIAVTEETIRSTLTQETSNHIEAKTSENKSKDENISIEITIIKNNTKRQPESSSHSLKPSSDINIPVQVFYDNAQNGYKESLKDNINETSTDAQTTTEDVKPDGGEYIYQSREDAINDETRKTVTVMENFEPKKCWSSEESSRMSTGSSDSVTTTTIQNFVTDEAGRVVTNCDGKPYKFETTSQWIIVDPSDVTGGIYEQIDITRSKKANNTDIHQKMIEDGIITTTEASPANPNTVNITLPILDVLNSTQVDIPVNNTNAEKNNTNAIKEEETSTVGVIVNINNLYEEVTSEIHTTATEPSTIAIPASALPETSYQENNDKEPLISEKPTVLILSTKNRFEEINIKSSSFKVGDVETQLKNSQKNLMELESKYNEHRIKELKVYEIPPGQPMFVKNQPNIPKDFPKISEQEIVPKEPSKNGEQPNYVPIYNYSPNNAYFNAYNRLGPNYEDEEVNKNRELISTNVLRMKADSSISFESREKVNKKYYFYNSAPSIKKIRSKILLPPSMPKYKKKKYNPQIYLDDYTDTEENSYFRNQKMHKIYARNSKKHKKSKKLKEKKSSEESMPVDEMYVRGTIKNHIEAVRNFLSKKNYFQFYESPSAAKEKKKNKKSILWNKLNPQKEQPKSGKDLEKNNKAADEQKRRKKRKRLLRAQGDIRYEKSKPNKRPKTGTVDGFHNRHPKYGQGIDLDYYFGRAGPDISSSSSQEMSLSSSKESSFENAQISIGKLGSIYYSKPQEKYDEYRRKNPETNSADKTQKKDKSGDPKLKFTVEDFNLVKNISAASDLVPNVLMMQKLVGIGKRSDDNNNFKHYLTVLADMIDVENKALLRYDWLGSAVDIQSALRKLIDLTEQLNDGDFNIHPSDWELFKYVFYIYETVDLDEKQKSKNRRKMLHPAIPEDRIKENIIVEREFEKLQKEALKFFPKTKFSGPKKLKKIAPYYSLRAQKKVYVEKLNEKKKLLKNILDFQHFLNSVLDNLNDLHDAIKHIGMVSKYKTVKWFKNIKEVYLNNPRKKEVLTVLLHLSMNRVINLIEESAKEGAERSFVSYVRRARNALKIRGTKEEVSFVLSILRELEKLDY